MRSEWGSIPCLCLNVQFGLGLHRLIYGLQSVLEPLLEPSLGCGSAFRPIGGHLAIAIGPNFAVREVGQGGSVFRLGITPVF